MPEARQQQNNQTQEPEFVIVEEGSEPTQNSQQSGNAETSGETQERAGAYEYAEEEGQGDRRVGHTQQEVEGEGSGQGQESEQELTARQRRRQREKEARRREQAELIRLRQENSDLRQRQQQFDSRLANVEQSGIDGQIASLESEISRANNVMQRAMEAQNGGDFIKAQELRDAFRDRLQMLKMQKAQRDSESGQQERFGQGGQTQAAPNGLHPAQVHYARIFIQRHPWYDSNGGDQDSQSVQQIDNEMVAQGLNPTTPDYWVELERRVREELPHKYQSAVVQSQGTGQGQTMNNGNGRSANNGRGATGGPKLPGSGNSGGSNGSAGGPQKFHLSPARKQALVDLGVWGDQKAMEPYIRRFMQYDKDQSTKQ